MNEGEKFRITGGTAYHGFEIGEVVEFSGDYTSDASIERSSMPIFRSESKQLTRAVSYLDFEPADMKGAKFRVWSNDGSHGFDLDDIVYHTGRYTNDFLKAEYRRESDGFRQYVARKHLEFKMQMSDEALEHLRKVIGRKPRKDDEK